MAKIMFNERYGLQQAVMDGTKTMTRRIVRCPKRFKDYEGEWCNDIGLEFHGFHGFADFYYDCVVVDGDGRELGQLPLPYETGDVVAIAQRYEDVLKDERFTEICKKRYSEYEYAVLFRAMSNNKGCWNKMFTREFLMPHHIQITDLWFERLQDISDEDCLREGVQKWMDCYIVTGIMENRGKNNVCFDTPRDAFAALIDRISGRGTWEENPWVTAYEFKRTD